MRRLIRALRRCDPLGPLEQNERVDAGDQRRPPSVITHADCDIASARPEIVLLQSAVVMVDRRVSAGSFVEFIRKDCFMSGHHQPTGETMGDKKKTISGMTFGGAIEWLKAGKKVQRTGWNGKGMYLWLMPGATVKAEWCREPHLAELAAANGGEIECLGSIRMYTVNADGRRAVLTGWLASQTDMLAEDWRIFEDN